MADFTISKIEGEHIVLSALPELSLQILQYAREHGQVAIRDKERLQYYPQKKHSHFHVSA